LYHATHARWFRDTCADDRGCQVWRGTQSRGEVLFVPRDLYHATLNQTHTVGVTWRWDPARAFLSRLYHATSIG